MLSVMLGGILGHWYESRNGFLAASVSTALWSNGPIIGSTIIMERLVLGQSDPYNKIDGIVS